MATALAVFGGLLLPLTVAATPGVAAPAPLSFTPGINLNDADPASGVLTIPCCASGAVALDYQNRSMGVDFGQPMDVVEVTLINRSATSRVTEGDWSLWASVDNVAWTEISGWSFAEAIVAGTQQHTFSDFEVTARYLKMHSAFGDSAFTFALSTAASGIIVMGSEAPLPTEVLPYTPGLNVGDAAPATGALIIPGGTSPTAVDYQNRSVGFDLSAQALVTEIAIVNRTATSRITEDDWTLWASDDNVAWTEVTGWTFAAELVGARQHHVFSDLNVTARYFKFNSGYSDTAFTFVTPSGAEAFIVRGVPPVPPDPWLAAAYSLVSPDWDPATGRVPGEFNPAPGALGLDYLRRSVVADLGGVSTIERIELRDNNAATRLTESDYSVWVSLDNQSYRELTGWTLSSTVDGGRLIQAFDGISEDARFVKVAQEWADADFTFTIADATQDFRIYGSDPVPAPADAGLRVIDSWEVTTDATFPDAADPSTMEAYRPAVTRAPNGDLVMVFNTSTDGNPGGEIRLIRSTDDGATWSASEILATPSIWAEGSMSSSRGLTTLSDGTLIVTFGEAINHTRFGNREGVTYVGRSTDNGHTWTGLDSPVVPPQPFRQLFAAGGRIVETSDGTLLLPFWGSRDLSDHWEVSPTGSSSVVLRSFDGGLTWPDMRVVAFDENVPPGAAGLGGSYTMAMGPNEFDIKEMPDGRLVALIRTDSVTDPLRFQLVRAYSDDGGATWSEPLATGHLGPAFSFQYAPCSAFLPAGQSKLVIGHRGLVDRGKALLAVSFDEGVTWQDETALVDPLGRDYYGLLGGEVEFIPLDDRRMLAFFQAADDDRPFVPPGEVTHPWRIMVNVIEDAAPTDCAAQAATASAALDDEPTLLIERDDRDSWMWQLGTRNARLESSTTIGQLTETFAPALSCRVDQPLQLLDPQGTPLDPDETIADANLASGDELRLLNPERGDRPLRIGVSDVDAGPDHRIITNWDDACERTRLELDVRRRSLGLDIEIPDGSQLSAVELRSMFPTTRLEASSYTLWTGDENGEFTMVPEWTLVERIEDGRLVHRFEGLASQSRYLKIATSFTNAAFSFVLDDPSEDISVEFVDAPDEPGSPGDPGEPGDSDGDPDEPGGPGDPGGAGDNDGAVLPTTGGGAPGVLPVVLGGLLVLLGGVAWSIVGRRRGGIPRP